MGAFKVVSGSEVKNHIFPLHSGQNRFRTDCMSGPERSILGVLKGQKLPLDLSRPLEGRLGH